MSAPALRLVPPPHTCDTGIFDRATCPEPCGVMHSYCATCEVRQDDCVHEIGTVPTGRADFEVRWVEADQSYLATAADYPALNWSDPDPGEAVRGLLALVVEVLAP